jgi:hypothetical protein
VSDALSRDCIAAFVQDSLRVHASARTVASVMGMWLANGVAGSSMLAAIDQVAATPALDRGLLDLYRLAVADMLDEAAVTAV